MSIKDRYLVPETTGIAGIGTGTGVGTLLLVVPVPNTEKTLDFGFSVPVLPKYVKIPVSGKSTGNRYAY
jgi:hypothetical protein